MFAASTAIAITHVFLMLPDTGETNTWSLVSLMLAYADMKC